MDIIPTLYKNISVAGGNNIETDRLYERRPDSRSRNTVYSQIIHQLENSGTLRASYRYYTDDWGINAHTIDVNYRWHLKNGHYIEPSVRLYNQNEADFYFRSLSDTAALPSFASSDSRLAEMESQSFAFKYGIVFDELSSVRIRLESLDQTFENAVIKDNRALILQISYKRGL